MLVVVLLVAPTGPSGIALVLVAPIATLAWRARGLRVPDGVAVGRLAALGAGFVTVAALVLGPTVARLGATRFAHDVLHLGSGVADLFLLPVGWPAVAATLLGLAVLAAGAARSGVLAGVALLVAVAASGAAEAPHAAAAARLGAERAAMAALPLALLGGLALLAREPRITPALAVAVLGGGAALSAPGLRPPDAARAARPAARDAGRAGGADAPSACRRRARRAWPSRVALALAGGRFLPSGRAIVALGGGRAAAVELPTGTLVALPEGLERLRAIGAAADAVAARTRPQERVLAFPACAAVPFLAGRLPAGPHDYFYPGRPTRAEVAELAARLRAAPPPAAVTCDAPGRLAGAWESYPELAALLEERYRVIARCAAGHRAAAQRVSLDIRA